MRPLAPSPLVRSATAALAVLVAAGLTLVGLGALSPAGAHEGGPDDPGYELAPPTLARGQVADSNARCIRGTARTRGTSFGCDKVDLLSWLDYDDLSGAGVEITFVNDIWGWTHEGRDYTLLGTTEGVVFVDVTVARRPDVLGLMPTASTLGGEFWRDVKVYDDHAFVVSEHDGHPVQVFDLTRLVGAEGYQLFTPDTLYAGTATQAITHAHNIAIDERTGYAFVVGSDSCNGGLHMVDVRDPANPAFAGCWGRDGYVHDVECTVYRGPDTVHRGEEVCVAANAEPRGDRILNRVSIIDVTDKTSPVRLGRTAYPSSGYSHQGSLTADQRFYLHGDELDETGGTVRGTTTRVFDVRDLERPSLRGTFTNKTAAIDHNIYTDRRWAYASNYTSGLRVYGLGAVQRGRLVEKAFFDVYPQDDRPTFEGTWSNFADFGSPRLVAVSSIDRGLFLLRPRLKGQG